MIEIKYLRPELLEAIARNTLKKYDESLVSGYDAKEVPIEDIIESMGLSLEYQYIRNNGRILGETVFEDAYVPNYNMTDFKPKQGKIRKSGTGGIYQISENLWEGRFTPTNAQGKREAHNVYAKTREECERLLDEMIVEVRQQIQAEKEQMKGMSL